MKNYGTSTKDLACDVDMRKETETETMLKVMVAEICSKLMADTKPQVLVTLEHG